MLKQIFIRHLILIDEAAIPFGRGFNVLSGETGAGKSAIMSALGLVAGKRADTSLVRKGASQAVVEAHFDVTGIPQVLHLLEDAGIIHPEGEALCIRREISASGKSRSLVNDQVVQLVLLSKLCHLLMDVVGQHANQNLLHPEYPMEMVDAFGELDDEVGRYRQSYTAVKRLVEAIEDLKTGESRRLRELEVCRYEIDEIESAGVKEGEEEDLFIEYTRLANTETLAQRLQEFCDIMSEGSENVLQTLRTQKQNLHKVQELDPSAKDTLESLERALFELEECAYSMTKAKGRLEEDPGRADQVDARLGLIRHLKKKYGPTEGDILNFLQQGRQRLEELENADFRLTEYQKQLETVRKDADEMAAFLTAARKKYAAQLSERLTEEIRRLNMGNAIVEIAVEPSTRNAQGDDHVECFLTPNRGEKKIAARHCASGGELSRLMLALKTVMSHHDQTPTLVFDEIDANIGGQTATVVGERLQILGDQHQVICITHFPQVASCAHHHIKISKSEGRRRTVTEVAVLKDQDRQEELTRMLGGSQMVEELVRF